MEFKKFLRAMCMVVVCIALITGLTSCVVPQDTHQTEKEVAVGIVHSTAVGLGALLEDIQDEDEQINLIRSFIDPIRFYDDQSGYFYVYNFDCINIAHAIQKLAFHQEPLAVVPGTFSTTRSGSVSGTPRDRA